MGSVTTMDNVVIISGQYVHFGQRDWYESRDLVNEHAEELNMKNQKKG